ncbi:Ig-like domain-containing protein, partial [Methanobrevibacter sp.]|uniref:Ig-like domain-containing protein n=1 Tax=Methanobrevibacter sp. TaxID=66852 RepID=UPI002E7977BF
TGNNANGRYGGGAVYWQGSNGNLTGSNFNGNNAELGGAVYWYGSNGVLSGSNFTNNTANNRGGAVYWNSADGVLSGSNFTGNTADDGGAVFWNGARGVLSGSNFNGNNANGDMGRGGAVYWSGDNSNINATFINNTAKNTGGAICVNKFSASTVTGTYINNTASRGTIFFIKSDKLDVEIKNAIFLNNKCGYEISANSWHSDIVVNDCWFGNNASNFKDKPTNKINNVIMSNWLFLNATADHNSLLVMNSTNITFKLNSTNGQDVFEFDNSKLPAVNLALTATKGDVEKTTTLDDAVKYVATEYGKGSVTASIENAKHTIFFDNIELNPKFSAEVNPQVIDYGKNTTIMLSYNDTATGTVNITFTGKKHNHKIENVDLNKTIQLPNTILPDEYEVTVTYSGDKVFANASATSALTVNKLKSDIKVVGHDIYVNETRGLMFNVTLPGNATGNLNISNGTILNVTKEGRKENNSLIIEIMNNAYPIGKYEWTFTYSGDDIYESSQKIAVANILITPTEITANVTSKLFVDNTTQVSYNLTPDGAVGDIIFTSNDTGVVEVDKNGNIKAIAEGTALITVTFEGSENYTASSTNITITVSKIPTEINITNETVELKALQSIGGLASLNPAEAGNLTYTSSDEDIVLVSDDGIIYARIKGTATVTVSFAGDGKYKAAQNKTIKVTVTLNDARVSVENDTLDLFVDDTCIINATANPQSLTVNYTSSDESVATVTDYGNVKAVGEGTTFITLTVGDGETYAINYTYVKVTVSKIPTEILITNETLDLKVNDKVDSGAGLNPSEAGNLTYTISETSIIKLLD